MLQDANTVDWISRGIGLVSLALAGLSLIVSWRVSARDKGDFSAVCRYLPKSGVGVAFLVTVTNTGRRPVTVDDALMIDKTNARFSYKEMAARTGMFGTDLPKTLSETEKVDLFMPVYHIREGPRDPRSYKAIEVVDTLGKRRRVGLRPVVRGIPDHPMFLQKKDRPQSEPPGDAAA